MTVSQKVPLGTSRIQNVKGSLCIGDHAGIVWRISLLSCRLGLEVFRFLDELPISGELYSLRSPLVNVTLRA